MNEPLRILLLEDSLVDADLDERVLRDAGLAFATRRVANREEFVNALREFMPDVILADYHLPDFDGLQALDIARQASPDTPFIFVTGAMGEGPAVESIKRGATDYILKDRLSRLPTAVQRALLEKEQLVRRREAEEATRESERRYRSLAENLRDVIYRADPIDWKVSYINRAVERIFCHTAAEWLKEPGLWERTVHPEDFERVSRAMEEARDRAEDGEVEYRIVRPDGTLRWVSDRFGWERDASGRIVSINGVVSDITERVERELQIRTLNRTLRTISACNEDLVRSRTEDDLLRAICRDIVEIGGCQLAWVTLPDLPGGNEYRTAAHFGDETALQAHASLEANPEHADRCATRIALRERRLAAVDGQSKSGECVAGQLDQFGVRAVLSLPLLVDHELLGALTIFSRDPDAFSVSDEVALMVQLAADLAYGIAALRTAHERDGYLNRYRQAMKNTVATIARTLELRDPYTAGHQQRVTTLAVATAREMHLDEELIEGLYFGSIIHDIGKIAVPAEVLSRPGRLNPVEYQLVQGHCVAGSELFRDIELPWPVARMIVQHHERIDGSGYPFGLKGDSICLEARIIAVADVVEAMSSHRPYRASLGIEAALAEIERGSGTRYDPDVTAACIKVLHANGMKLPGS